jgi:hypothetical protein
MYSNQVHKPEIAITNERAKKIIELNCTTRDVKYNLTQIHNDNNLSQTAIEQGLYDNMLLLAEGLAQLRTPGAIIAKSKFPDLIETANCFKIDDIPEDLYDNLKPKCSNNFINKMEVLSKTLFACFLQLDGIIVNPFEANLKDPYMYEFQQVGVLANSIHKELLSRVSLKSLAGVQYQEPVFEVLVYISSDSYRRDIISGDLSINKARKPIYVFQVLNMDVVHASRSLSEGISTLAEILDSWHIYPEKEGWILPGVAPYEFHEVFEVENLSRPMELKTDFKLKKLVSPTFRIREAIDSRILHRK